MVTEDADDAFFFVGFLRKEWKMQNEIGNVESFVGIKLKIA